MYVHPSSCAARRYLLFVESESCYWRPTTYLHWVGVLLVVMPRDLTTALVTECQSIGMCAILFTWANEIRILRTSSLFHWHRNQVTRLSGWRVPREQHTVPRRNIRGPSVVNGYSKLPENYIVEAFERPGFLSDFHISPEHCDLGNEVAHILASATQSEITQEFTIMMLHHRQNQSCGYDRRKEKRLHVFTSTAASHQLSIELNAAHRGSSDITASIANYHLDYVHRNSYGYYKLRIARCTLKSWCNIPVPFICYLLLKTFLQVFLGLFLG